MGDHVPTAVGIRWIGGRGGGRDRVGSLDSKLIPYNGALENGSHDVIHCDTVIEYINMAFSR